MAKLEGEETNENSYMQDLQMLQDLLEDGEARRRRNKPELIDALRPSNAAKCF